MNGRRYFPKPRIASVMAQAGGIRVNRAVQQAKANLESIREASIAEIVRKIDQVSTNAAQGRDFIYQRSNEIFCEAGAFGMIELSSVARSLCDLLCRTAPATPREIELHLQAMRALANPALMGNEAARKAVLAGLKDMSKRG